MSKSASGALVLAKGKSKRLKKEKAVYLNWFLLLILFLVALVSFTVGSYKLSLGAVVTIFYDRLMGITDSFGSNIDTVVFLVRMPRIIAALIIGCALSVAGSSYQGLFRNPMVAPDILGASGGAGFGAALGLLLSLNSFEVQILSFLCGLGAVLAAVGINSVISRNGGGSLLTLIMTGIVISSLAQAFISLMKYIGDPDNKLPEITFWLMGSLSTITMNDLLFLLIPVCLAVVPLFLLRWRLNILSFGDEEATALGINTRRMKMVVIVCSTLATAATVSVAGIIGWIGLIIPHLARMIVGPNYKLALPASLLIGSIYLILVDDVARMFTVELPLGILTSLIGAPFFLYLLLKGRRGWS
ncbi:MAG: iron ABC transporter permease [Sporolactobacillus sp.]